MERSLARIDPEIFQAIWNKVKKEYPRITRKTIYDRIKTVRREFGNAISPRMAANVLASRIGIDVYKIIKNRSELEELRDLRSRTLMRDLLKETLPPIVPKRRKTVAPKKPSKKVFIVHGRDDKSVRKLKSMLTQFGLKPIVLHEQPSGSRTVVEKLEKYSDVGYAFVILTPDDMGSEGFDYTNLLISAAGKLRYVIEADSIIRPKATLQMALNELMSLFGFLKPRARQNVVLEFGYFIGLLRRDKVCCLHKGDVELPSDVRGIVYVPFKKSVTEAREKIIRELKAAKYDLRTTKQ